MLFDLKIDVIFWLFGKLFQLSMGTERLSFSTVNFICNRKLHEILPSYYVKLWSLEHLNTNVSWIPIFSIMNMFEKVMWWLRINYIFGFDDLLIFIERRANFKYLQCDDFESLINLIFTRLLPQNKMILCKLEEVKTTECQNFVWNLVSKTFYRITSCCFNIRYYSLLHYYYILFGLRFEIFQKFVNRSLEFDQTSN